MFIFFYFFIFLKKKNIFFPFAKGCLCKTRLILPPAPTSALYLLQQQRLCRVRHSTLPNLNLLIPLRHSLGHLDIIPENQPRNNELHLVGGEEAARARVPAVAKRQVHFIGRDELVARVVGRAAVAPQVVVPEAVELVAVWVDFRVFVHGVGRSLDYHARREVLAVRECDALEDSAGKSG
jgi:hypothetical protein